MASTARIHTSQSNAMVYSEKEYNFWEFIENVHKESVLRDLTGEKYYSRNQKFGENGVQNPDKIKVNIAIPSRRCRKDKKEKPEEEPKVGIMEDSLESIKNAGIEPSKSKY